MSAASDAIPAKSGAAGTAKFVGSDSRRFNYFESKGRRSTQYEDVTVDVQPDPKRHLLQDWIMNFADGTPTHYTGWTQAKSSDWHKFLSVDQEWERTHYQRQSTIVGMLSSVLADARRAGMPRRIDNAWVQVLQDHVGAYKHAEFGLGTSMMRAQRYGYTQMVNNAILTNSSYKLRFAQDLVLYLGELALDIDGFDLEAGKRRWLEDPIWQGTRLAIESIMGASDYLEQYFAANVIFEPLVGELFRSGCVMRLAAAQNDYVSPVVVSAADGDYQRNLANSVELFSMLTQDQQHGEANCDLFRTWIKVHGKLALDAALLLQPIWSQPRVKTAQFDTVFELAKSRLYEIATQIGIDAANVFAA
jgi:propane 2-monooxygenase small subunit